MFFEILLETFHTSDPTDLAFFVALLISLLIMLYAMSLMSTRLRLLQEELQSLKSEQATMSEAMELMASVSQNKVNK